MPDLRVLVTCFEPFGERPINSSAVVAAHLEGRATDLDLRTATLPVSFARAWPALSGHVTQARPDAVVLLGQAARRTRVEVEQVAVNVAEATTPDNDGAQPRGEPVLDGGAAAHLATVPVHEAVTRMRAAGTPAGVSHSAGTYVCNHLYYLALHHLPHLPVVFAHLPLLPEQALEESAATMTVELMATGVARVLEVATETAAQGSPR